MCAFVSVINPPKSVWTTSANEEKNTPAKKATAKSTKATAKGDK